MISIHRKSIAAAAVLAGAVAIPVVLAAPAWADETAVFTQGQSGCLIERNEYVRYYYYVSPTCYALGDDDDTWFFTYDPDTHK